jgi:Gpi18-like mannosyltransferase
MPYDKAGWIVERIVLISIDALLACLIFKLLVPRVDKTRAYLGALLYLINPIIFAATTFWGQSDNLMVLIMLVAFWLIAKKRPLEAYLLAGGSLLFKPTLIAMMPFFALILLLDRKIKQFVLGSLALAIVFYLLGTIFFGGSVATVFKYYVDSLLINNLIPHMAVGARSLWFWLGETTPDSSKVIFVSAHLWGSLLLLGANCFGAWIYLKRKDLIGLTLAYLIILFGFYFLPTRSHERYQLFSFLPLIILISTQKRWWPAFVFYILSTITFGYTILAMVPFFKVEYFDGLLRNIRISNIIVGANLSLMIVAIVFAWYYPKQQYGKLKKDI